jgi:hypothetical protein
MTSAPANEQIPSKETTKIASFSIMDFISLLIYIALAAAAIWYGWKYGNQYAPWFWTKVQTYGVATGAFFGNVSERIRNYRKPAVTA